MICEVTTSGLKNAFGILTGFLIIGLIVIIVIYTIIASFLNKFNKLKYGKGTAMAWIPVFNIYLLGKLTFNKIVGFVLVLLSFLSGQTYIRIGNMSTESIVPEAISNIIGPIYPWLILAIFIYAIVKYNLLKREIKNRPSTSAYMDEIAQQIRDKKLAAQNQQMQLNQYGQLVPAQQVQNGQANGVQQNVPIQGQVVQNQMPPVQPQPVVLQNGALGPTPGEVVQPVNQPIQNQVPPVQPQPVELQNDAAAPTPMLVIEDPNQATQQQQ